MLPECVIWVGLCGCNFSQETAPAAYLVPAPAHVGAIHELNVTHTSENQPCNTLQFLAVLSALTSLVKSSMSTAVSPAQQGADVGKGHSKQDFSPFGLPGWYIDTTAGEASYEWRVVPLAIWTPCVVWKSC